MKILCLFLMIFGAAVCENLSFDEIEEESERGIKMGCRYVLVDGTWHKDCREMPYRRRSFLEETRALKECWYEPKHPNPTSAKDFVKKCRKPAERELSEAKRAIIKHCRYDKVGERFHKVCWKPGEHPPAKMTREFELDDIF